MDEQIVTYVDNRILSRNKKEQTTYTQKSSDESLKYCAQRNKPRNKSPVAVKICPQNLSEAPPIKRYSLI